MLFSSAIQPSVISLFSSTGSEPLNLFSSSTDKALPSDSFVHLLHDSLSLPPPPDPRKLLELPAMSDRNRRHDADESDDQNRRGRELDQTVLHIQSPTIRTTFIQCPPRAANGASVVSSEVLGIKHPWMHLQVRNLGRDWSFEVGIVDHADRTGVIRFSTFQKKPRLKIESKNPGSDPLLLLPLSFPSRSAYPLTPWSTITIHLPSLLPHFSSPLLRRTGDGDVKDADDDADELRHSRRRSTASHGPLPIPSGSYAHVSYVRVYATCRLRRIWFGESGPGHKVPWEFELYSTD